MFMADFEIKHEVTNYEDPNDWRLYFQWGVYHYDDVNSEEGYRFIWRYPDGKQQAARGQARIPSKQDLFELLALASKEGWF